MTTTPEKLRAAAKHGQWIPVPVADGPMLADAIELADSIARSDIESYCKSVEKEGKLWWDTYSAGPEDKDGIERALRYLDSRRLVTRNWEEPWLVRFEVAV